MKIESMTVSSRCLGRDIRVNIGLPAEPSGRWLLLLHGYGGDEREWLDKSPVAELAERFGLTLILPGCGDGYYEDTCEPMSRFLGEELPDLVFRHHPLSRKREDAFIAGASMGGFGALLIGSRYSHVYGKIAALGGAFIVHDICIGNPLIVAGADICYFRRVFGDFLTLEGSDRDPLYHVRQAMEARSMGPVHLLCGKEDLLYRSNLKMEQSLRSLGVCVDVLPVSGGHSWKTWNGHLETVFNWLEK